MKKQYQKPIIEIVILETEDVLSTSGKQTFDPDGLFEKDADNWF